MKTIKILLLTACSIFSMTAMAQDTTKHNALKQKSAKQTYVCPMHPKMVMNKPGQCPICGAQMGLSQKEQMKMEVMGRYTCPMHPDVVSNKPGKCTKCQSALALTPKEKMNEAITKKYSCSMHPGEVSDKPGKCSKCGMELTEVKAKHQH